MTYDKSENEIFKSVIV